MHSPLSPLNTTPPQALHAENELSFRFPIGKQRLIEGWALSDVKAFHDEHYFPGNAILCVLKKVSVSHSSQH